MGQEKGLRWQKFSRFLLLLLYSGISYAETYPREVDVVGRVSGFLSSGGGYEVVETGNLDVDGDGDLDLLVEMHNDKNVIERGRWTVYFNEEGKYVHAGRQSFLPMFRDNLAFRRTEQSGSTKAVVWYNQDAEGFFRAHWFEKTKNGSYKRKSEYASDSYLLTPQKDAILGAPADKWKDKGLKVEDLLMNYKRYSSEEAARAGLR
jgi:hypothetical protein